MRKPPPRYPGPLHMNTHMQTDRLDQHTTERDCGQERSRHTTDTHPAATQRDNHFPPIVKSVALWQKLN